MLKKNIIILAVIIGIVFIFTLGVLSLIPGGSCSRNPYIMHDSEIHLKVGESVKIAYSVSWTCRFTPSMYLVNNSIAMVEYKEDGTYLTGVQDGMSNGVYATKELLDKQNEEKALDNYIEQRLKNPISIIVSE